MSYIAKTNGGNTVLELRVGTLSDIPEDDRANWRVAYESFPNVNRMFYNVTGPVISVNGDGSQVNIQWQSEEKPEAMKRLHLKEHAAQVRWHKQQAGITLNGMKIKTDDESLAKIHQVFSILEKEWVPSVVFKTGNGFVELDLAGITAVSQAAMTHIQSCFVKEKEIIEAIEAGTVTTTSQIDGWEWQSQ